LILSILSAHARTGYCSGMPHAHGSIGSSLFGSAVW
jgi:hypothetical protein